MTRSTTSGVQASPILASSSGYSAGINDGLQYPAQTFHNTSYMTPPQVYVTMPQYSNPTATTLHPYAVNPGNAGFYPPNPPQGNPKSNLSTHTHVSPEIGHDEQKHEIDDMQYPYGNVNHQGSSQQGSEASKSKDDKKDKDKDKKVTKKDGHQK